MWMGLENQDSLTYYWRKSDWPHAANSMSRNRFEILLRTWHYAKNKEAEQFDRLHKIQSLARLLNENFKDENVCIDETMVSFKGHLKFHQFIKENVISLI